ncbi:Aste57867_11341 [Aphanomyces stellatus]|uniref:Aste57867_11341 protein n=1 Tax=Aphanomyces stellatus TaxID=120398 RepID=A0A485KSS6_9STRA|nr:hypothetical protein As57867_011299 [Aphanomyces stellatus]VFT88203.1 Aste57867_11341 [Aphanomyces stellatus]
MDPAQKLPPTKTPLVASPRPTAATAAAAARLPPRLDRPGVHQPHGVPSPKRAAPPSPAARPPPEIESSLASAAHMPVGMLAESSWLREDEFIYDAYFANQTRRPATSSVGNTRPAPAAPSSVLLHKQCVDAIAECSRSLQERRERMMALSLPFTPLKPRKTSRDGTFATPPPDARRHKTTATFFESDLSPIPHVPQPTPEPATDVRKRLDFTEEESADDKSLQTQSFVQGSSTQSTPDSKTEKNSGI